MVKLSFILLSIGTMTFGCSTLVKKNYETKDLTKIFELIKGGRAGEAKKHFSEKSNGIDSQPFYLGVNGKKYCAENYNYCGPGKTIAYYISKAESKIKYCEGMYAKFKDTSFSGNASSSEELSRRQISIKIEESENIVKRMEEGYHDCTTAFNSKVFQEISELSGVRFDSLNQHYKKKLNKEYSRIKDVSAKYLAELNATILKREQGVAKGLLKRDKEWNLRMKKFTDANCKVLYGEIVGKVSEKKYDIVYQDPYDKKLACNEIKSRNQIGLCWYHGLLTMKSRTFAKGEQTHGVFVKVTGIKNVKTRSGFKQNWQTFVENKKCKKLHEKLKR